MYSAHVHVSLAVACHLHDACIYIQDHAGMLLEEGGWAMVFIAVPAALQSGPGDTSVLCTSKRISLAWLDQSIYQIEGLFVSLS